MHFKRLIVAISCAFIYYWCFYLNKLIFDEFEFSFGVNWVFIPSGLQLIMVLVAVEDAAIGLILASCLIGFENYQLESIIRTLVTGIISGASPLLARKICLDFLHVDKDLRSLTPKSILIMSVVFSAVSSALHQIWFYHNGVTDNFISSLVVMGVGDMLGTAIVLSLISIGTNTLLQQRHKDN